MKKRKVLHFLESEGMYGAEQVVLSLSKKMAESGKYEPQIACIIPNIDSTSDLCKEASKVSIKSKNFVISKYFFIKNLIKILKWIKREKVEILHCHGYKASVFGFFISKFSGINIISTCHLWYKDKNMPFKYIIMTKLEIFLYKYFPYVVAVSEPIAAILKKRYDENKIITIINGVCLDDFRKYNKDKIRKLKEELNLSKDVKIILSVGRLTEQKAQHLIIDAVGSFINKKNIRVFIIGDGTLKGNLSKQIEQNNLTGIITLLGFRDDISDFLSIADVFVLPSNDEGMPIALLEAVAAEVPVITTDVGSITELIINGESGLIIPKNSSVSLANAIEEILKDRQSALRMANVGKEILKRKFSLDSMFFNYDKLYDKLHNMGRK